MADAKITALSALTSWATGDVLAIVDDPSGTPVTKKMTLDNLFGAIPVGVLIGSSLPGSGDGSLHVHDGSAGVVAASSNATIAVFEGSGGENGISILAPDGAHSNVYFGSPSLSSGAALDWKYSNNDFQVGTNKAGAKMTLRSGADVTALTLDSSQDATFAGGVAPASYTDAGRPAATAVPTGSMIWNTDDGFPNWSDGTNWVDATGATT